MLDEITGADQARKQVEAASNTPTSKKSLLVFVLEHALETAPDSIKFKPSYTKRCMEGTGNCHAYIVKAIGVRHTCAITSGMLFVLLGLVQLFSVK